MGLVPELKLINFFRGDNPDSQWQYG